MNLASIRSTLAKSAYLSILGSIGQGAGSAIPNFAVASNGNVIGAAQTNTFGISGFVAKTTGRILLVGLMTTSTSVLADEVSYEPTIDGSPVPTFPLGQMVVASAGADKVAPGVIAWIESVAVNGAPHAYAILATNTTGGHTVATETGLATVILYELP